ncbi:phage tail spike protein [Janthinobacterium sp.]|uniref:phage tail spike protein n=1 Tax=Janthinobacterium sp. TaxID=1871054 RepID=UPI002607F2DB|nr:phage tail spike protein [Janthinobacterium sp.]
MRVHSKPINVGSLAGTGKVTLYGKASSTTFKSVTALFFDKDSAFVSDVSYTINRNTVIQKDFPVPANAQFFIVSTDKEQTADSYLNVTFDGVPIKTVTKSPIDEKLLLPLVPPKEKINFKILEDYAVLGEVDPNLIFLDPDDITTEGNLFSHAYNSREQLKGEIDPEDGLPFSSEEFYYTPAYAMKTGSTVYFKYDTTSAVSIADSLPILFIYDVTRTFKRAVELSADQSVILTATESYIRVGYKAVADADIKAYLGRTTAPSTYLPSMLNDPACKFGRNWNNIRKQIYEFKDVQYRIGNRNIWAPKTSERLGFNGSVSQIGITSNVTYGQYTNMYDVGTASRVYVKFIFDEPVQSGNINYELYFYDENFKYVSKKSSYLSSTDTEESVTIPSTAKKFIFSTEVKNKPTVKPMVTLEGYATAWEESPLDTGEMLYPIPIGYPKQPMDYYKVQQPIPTDIPFLDPDHVKQGWNIWSEKFNTAEGLLGFITEDGSLDTELGSYVYSPRFRITDLDSKLWVRSDVPLDDLDIKLHMYSVTNNLIASIAVGGAGEIGSGVFQAGTYFYRVTMKAGVTSNVHVCCDESEPSAIRPSVLDSDGAKCGRFYRNPHNYFFEYRDLGTQLGINIWSPYANVRMGLVGVQKGHVFEQDLDYCFSQALELHQDATTMKLGTFGYANTIEVFYTLLDVNYQVVYEGKELVNDVATKTVNLASYPKAKYLVLSAPVETMSEHHTLTVVVGNSSVGVQKLMSPADLQRPFTSLNLTDIKDPQDQGKLQEEFPPTYSYINPEQVPDNVNLWSASFARRNNMYGRLSEGAGQVYQSDAFIYSPYYSVRGKTAVQIFLEYTSINLDVLYSKVYFYDAGHRVVSVEDLLPPFIGQRRSVPVPTKARYVRFMLPNKYRNDLISMDLYIGLGSPSTSVTPSPLDQGTAKVGRIYERKNQVKWSYLDAPEQEINFWSTADQTRNRTDKGYGELGAENFSNRFYTSALVVKDAKQFNWLINTNKANRAEIFFLSNQGKHIYNSRKLILESGTQLTKVDILPNTYAVICQIEDSSAVTESVLWFGTDTVPEGASPLDLPEDRVEPDPEPPIPEGDPINIVANQIDFHVYSPNEDFKCSISNTTTHTGIVVTSAVNDEKLNSIDILEIVIEGESPDSELIFEQDLLYTTIGGTFKEYIISRIIDEDDGTTTRTLICELSSVELQDDIIYLDRDNVHSAEVTLRMMLEGTRWRVSHVDANVTDEPQDMDFKYKSVLEGIFWIANSWGMEVKFHYIVKDGEVSHRLVSLYNKRGRDTYKQFEMGYDTRRVEREVDTTDIKTAIIPLGAMLKDIPDEHGEMPQYPEGQEDIGEQKLDISTVVWSKPTNPENKSVGQIILSAEEALNQWGRPSPDGLRDRIFVSEFSEIKNADELIMAGYKVLLGQIVPRITYKLDVADLYTLLDPDLYEHERLDLGDRVVVVDDYFPNKLQVQTRIIEVKRDLLLPENTSIVLGDPEADYIGQSIEDNKEISDSVNDANQNAQDALDSANGKNKTYYSATEPSGTHQIGDSWVRPHPTIEGETQWLVWDGNQWKIEMDTSVTNISNEIQDLIDKAIEDAQEALDLANSYQAEIEQAKKDALDALAKADESMTLTKSEVIRLENEIQSIQNITDIDKINETLTELETRVTQNATDISLKAEKTVVDGIEETIKHQDAEIKVNAEGITQLVRDYEDQDIKIGKVELSADRFETMIAEIGGVDNIAQDDNPFPFVDNFNLKSTDNLYAPKYSERKQLNGKPADFTGVIEDTEGYYFSPIYRVNPTMRLYSYLSAMEAGIPATFDIRCYFYDGAFKFLSYQSMAVGIVGGTKNYVPPQRTCYMIVTYRKESETMKGIKFTLGIADPKGIYIESQLDKPTGEVGHFYNSGQEMFWDFRDSSPLIENQWCPIQSTRWLLNGHINDVGAVNPNIPRARITPPIMLPKSATHIQVRAYLSQSALENLAVKFINRKTEQVGTVFLTSITEDRKLFTVPIPDGADYAIVSGTATGTVATENSFMVLVNSVPSAWARAKCDIPLPKGATAGDPSKVIMSTIQQEAGKITLQTMEDNIVSSINLSKEGIRIQGQKIEITGQTFIEDAVIGTANIINGSITNAKILNLDGNKIVANSITANKLKAGEITTDILLPGTYRRIVLEPNKSPGNNDSMSIDTNNDGIRLKYDSGNYVYIGSSHIAMYMYGYSETKFNNRGMESIRATINNLKAGSQGRIKMESSVDGNGVNFGYSGSKLNQVSAVNVWGDGGSVSDIKFKENVKYLSDNSKPKSVFRSMMAMSAPSVVDTTIKPNPDNNINLGITGQDLHNFVRHELSLCEYNYNDEYYSDSKTDSVNDAFRNKIGFIAQDLLHTKVGKTIVGEHEGALAYNLNNYTSAIAGALQEEIRQRELKQQELEFRLERLENR